MVKPCQAGTILLTTNQFAQCPTLKETRLQKKHAGKNLVVLSPGQMDSQVDAK